MYLGMYFFLFILLVICYASRIRGLTFFISFRKFAVLNLFKCCLSSIFSFDPPRFLIRCTLDLIILFFISLTDSFYISSLFVLHSRLFFQLCLPVHSFSLGLCLICFLSVEFLFQQLNFYFYKFS